MKRVPFAKMHGLGNDFVVVDEKGLPPSVSIDAEFARAVCDRRFGVGADQVLWLKTPHDPGADARMEIFNTDGSVAEMCGNGIRAVALFLRLKRKDLAQRQKIRIETLAGILEVDSVADGFRVNMGIPQLGSGLKVGGENLDVAGRALRFFEVSMGNPHAVVFGEDLEKILTLGPAIERHPRFPRRTNVEFVVPEEGALRVRVWERGAGLTLACGTGACAAAVAAFALGRVLGSKREVEVRLPGGSLHVAWEGLGQPAYLRGPAQLVFEGELVDFIRR